jgi:hypothetical protein
VYRVYAFASFYELAVKRRANPRHNSDWYTPPPHTQFDITLIPSLGIWLRENTSKIFNVCRVPHPTLDSLSQPPSPSCPSARKVLVLLHDWCYTIDVYDTDWRPVPWEEIERRLGAVVRDVEERRGRGERAVPVSVLTSDERNRWAEV